MLEADQWLDAMDQTAPDSLQARALIYAAVVAYARPFTISQVTPKERVVPLKDIPPPLHLAATHTMILDLRNKVIGHKDATPAVGNVATPNIILIKLDATGLNLRTVNIKGMTPGIRKEWKSLCSHFVAHCVAQIHPLFMRYYSEIRRQPDGVYELLVTEPPDDWIRLHK